MLKYFIVISVVSFARDTVLMNIFYDAHFRAPPTWQDSSNNVVFSVSFDFTGIAGSTAGVDVESDVESIKLVEATSYPATISVSRPRFCDIGATDVKNGHVELISAGSSLGNNFDINENEVKDFQLRFKSAGNYGDKTGAVHCFSPGTFTYTY